VRRSDLQTERRYHVLDAHDLKCVQEKLRQIAVGPLDGSSGAWEDESNPDYHAWIAQVTEAVLLFPERSRRQAIILTDSDFTPRTIPLSWQTREERALAAAGADPFAEQLAPPLGELSVLANSLSFSGPGEMWVIRESDGAAIVFQARVAATPPAVEVDLAGEWQPLTWKLTSDQTAGRVSAAWLEDQIRFRVGTGDDSQEIVVLKP
jgi:hypothetical protein